MTFFAALLCTLLMMGCDVETDTPETPEPVTDQEVSDTPEPEVEAEFEVAETPEALFQQMITLMNGISGQLESVRDHASADTAAMEIDSRYTPRVKAVAERLLSFAEEIGWDALDEIAEQFNVDGEAAAERLYTQIERVEMDETLKSPKLGTALQNFEETLDSLDE